MKILITGAGGNAGQAVSRRFLQEGHEIRMADVSPPASGDWKDAQFVRCDVRTPDDVRRAVEGMDAVVHLAAWHSAHRPKVSDPTIFAVNVDGTFSVLEACREFGVGSIVYASSMAYGWGSVYSVTKVIGEELCRSYHEMTGASIAMLRYHEFIPRPYLEFGERLLRNGVDRRDVVEATYKAAMAAIERRFGLFKTVVHTNHGMAEDVRSNFLEHGPAWCESAVPGSIALMEKYGLRLPNQVEQHDMSEAERIIGWKPAVGFLEFLQDLKMRDTAGQDVAKLWIPSELPRF